MKGTGFHCKELPSSEELNNLLTYNPETGELFWKKSTILKKNRYGNLLEFSRSKPTAGHRQYHKDGTRHCIRVRSKFLAGGRGLVAHRVIWRMMGREVPYGMVIDHKDRNPFNNRIDNLRIATCSQNVSNSDMVRKSGGKKDPSLPRGIDWHPRLKKYRVQISDNGKKKHIGVFLDLEAAKAAWMAAAEKAFGEFVHLTQKP